MEKGKRAYVSGGDVEWCRHFAKEFDSFSKKKVCIILPYFPTTAFPDIYPRDIKTYPHTKTCMSMFIAASFITARTWKGSNARFG